MDPTAKRVVIVGGGFAGLNAAKELAKQKNLAITLIDRRNFHVFQPLLYQVATGALSPADICAPLRAVLKDRKNVRVLMSEVTGFDVANRKVLMTDGEEPYDFLVVATGARHHYFGQDHWEDLAPGLKTVEDATEIRGRILSAYEAAEKEPDRAKRIAWLTFVIVGGGPTGVELAGTLGEIANDTLKDDFRMFRPEESRILLIESGDEILSTFPVELHQRAERDLLKLGVRVRHNTKVTGVDPEGVTVMSNGIKDHIPSRTVLWAAGVKASPLAKALAAATGGELDRAGRLLVTPQCQVPNYPEIFVLGDMAHCKGPDGQPLPGVAPVAMQQGTYVAKAIANTLANQPVPGFKYFNKGNLATVGRAVAIADFGRGWTLTGFPAWLLWLFIHIMYLVGYRNRLTVFVNWAFLYMTFNRGARLITAPIAPGPPSPAP